MISSIASAFHDGGIWMWAIMFAQMASIAIMAERIYALYILRQPNQKALMQNFEEDLKKGQLEKVIFAGKSMRSQPIGVIAQVGAQAALDMGGREEIQVKIDEVLLEESTRLERRTGFLAMLGNVGTLLGLLGTIVGLIRAFGSVGNADPLAKAAMLSNGVAEAMFATAYGLIMAIPAIVMFSVLQNRTNQLSEDLNKAALRVYVLLGFHYDAVPRKKSRSV
jgi:biopolymer transport protein ExbB